MTDLSSLDSIGPDDLGLVGGKGLSLGLLASAGLPVPAGFCLTTAVHRRLRGRALASEADLVDRLTEAIHSLGDGPVAVRSSATAEDGAATSFAGQQDTILGVVGPEAIRSAIERCWASLDSERAVAYRRQQGVREEGLAMAVVVQRLVPAEVAGVLFTRDPLDPTGRQMLVEASWGLGESVVSGRVTPDRFHLDRDTGQVLDRHIGTKFVQRIGLHEEPVPPERQTLACLDEDALARLAELGRRVEAYHGEPRDIEWALADGQFWLLQSRPITTGGLADREKLRQEEIANLRQKAAPQGTVWSRFNLSEVLPAPTPMTWAVVSRYLMSGKGGFGLMFRDLGSQPDPALDEVGIFDLICGRPYCNLSREPRLHDRVLPFEHPFALLKKDPRQALYPVPRMNPARLPWHFWLGLPITLPLLTLRLIGAGIRRQRLVTTFADQFTSEILPRFRAACDQAGRTTFATLDPPGLVGFFEHWCRTTLVDFARDSLKPTALAALCLVDLERTLALVVGPARAASFARDLVMGARPAPESDLAGNIRALATGKLPREKFLEQFGHRGPEEMELARPRWAEDPATLERPGHADPSTGHEVPLEERLARETRLSAEQRDLLLGEVRRLHTYLGLRETAKHELMRGHALIRRALVELDQRFGLRGGIFFLTPEDFPALLAGADLSAKIGERRRRRAQLLGIEVPSVLFSDDLEAIGRPMTIEGAERLQGVPLSAGVIEGPALVLEHPHVHGVPPEGYILVCPSTDPAWVPLFVNARGLVMETGGVLSHGAIVAREFGLPAVAGLPSIVQRLHTGQLLRVDGSQGTVTVLGEEELNRQDAKTPRKNMVSSQK